MTRGSVDAYVVREARIASIGRATAAASGPPAAPPDDVLRTTLVAGDTLLLASRDLIGALGAEELKSAALTLHPDAAAAHLRRLFAIHGGRGSDAALAIDASVSTDRRRVRVTEPRARSVGGRATGRAAGSPCRPRARVVHERHRHRRPARRRAAAR